MMLPIVVVGRRLPATSLVVVRAADSRGIAAAVDHLAALGHRRIVHATGRSGSIRADRRDGYLRAMRRHGLGESVSIIDGDFTEKAGMAAAEHLLVERALPTAVVAANDRIAIGLLDALRRAGVDVPGDVSITGYDDSPLARLSHIDLTRSARSPASRPTVRLRRSSNGSTAAVPTRCRRCCSLG